MGGRRNNDGLAVLARAAYLLTVAALAVASLAPANWVPRAFYSYHLEHFAAFYLVSLSMAAARYRASLTRLALDMTIQACVLEGLRLFIPSHRDSVPEDWISDLGGVLGALSAMFVSDFRSWFAPQTPSRTGEAETP